MAGILRGEIRWANLDPVQGSEQAGQRPILVLSHQVFNERSGTVIAMALTSRSIEAGYPLSLELANEGLPKRSWVLIGQVRTLSIQRVGRVIGQATELELQRAVDGLNEIIS